MKTLEEMIQALAQDEGLEVLRWAVREGEIVILFANGQKKHYPIQRVEEDPVKKKGRADRKK